MYGRLIEVEGLDPSRREEGEAIVREAIIPALKGIEGFAGLILLVDETNKRSRSVALWETREAAEEAERQMKAKRDEVIRQLGGSVRSADLFEAPIVEVPASARV